MPPALRTAKSNGRDKLMSKLQQHAGPWVPDTQELINSFVKSYIIALPDYWGAALGESSNAPCRFINTGEEITFYTIPLDMVVRKIAAVIGGHVPVDRRNDVYHKVLVGMRGYRVVPPWERRRNGGG